MVLHDGSRILLRKLDATYDPTNRAAATAAISERLKKGEFLTGLLYVDAKGKEFHDVNETPAIPLNQIPHKAAVAGVGGPSESSGQISLAALCFGPL